MTNANIIVE